MTRWLLLVGCLVGCGETQLGPFQDLPIDTRLDVDGTEHVIHVARDKLGIAHIYARSVRDLGFAEGYVMAHDRWPQMDMLRRIASGTMAEVYGAEAIAGDKEMRFQRMRRFAEDTWTELQISAEQRDIEVVALLERFSDGVNTYIADATRWTLDPALVGTGLEQLFAATSTVPWSPVDSIVILRLFMFAQSWTVPEELDMTAILEHASSLPAAKQGVEQDILALAPVGPLATGPAPPAPTGAPRPAIDVAVLDAARAFFKRDLTTSLQGTNTINAHSFMRPYVGSTAFAIGEDLTLARFEVGQSMLVADMQMALSTPSIFYPMHALVGTDDLGDEPLQYDIMGLMLPGVPVAIAGTNSYVGWAPTLAGHDVNDVYYEELACGGTCSRFNGVDEPLGSFTESIDVLGEEQPVMVTYQVVPRHGPIIPGNTQTAALSIRSTAYAATHELAELWELGTEARSIGNADTRLEHMRIGPHWMVIDQQGAFEWASYADVPDRPPTMLEWSKTTSNRAAPFLVLDGRSPDHEWRTMPLDRKVLPFRSTASTSIVIADADPIGTTLDGNPLDIPYLGVAYASSLRADRVSALLASEMPGIDESDLARIHHDTNSNFGAQLVNAIVPVLGMQVTTPDATTYYNGLGTDEKARIAQAHDVLDAWKTKLDTPAGSVAADASASATLLFNTFLYYFLFDALHDDLVAMNLDESVLGDERRARIAYRLLVDHTGLLLAAGEPVLCHVVANESCARIALQAALEAATYLRDTQGGPDDWRWGELHTLRMTPLFVDKDGVFTQPRSETGLQLPGDMFAVDRADGGWSNPTTFAPYLTVAYRMQIINSTVHDEPLRMRLELPSGTVLDKRDPHYNDLFTKSYVTRTPFDVPISLGEINAEGETRWELR